jgi:hypothetical protein
VARILGKSRRDAEMKVRLLIGDYLGTYGLLNLRSTGSVIRYERESQQKKKREYRVNWSCTGQEATAT